MVRAAAEYFAAETGGAVRLGVVAMSTEIRSFTFHSVKESACW
ncbi:hypothetical protein CCUG63695_04780 [Mycobacteroides franklinii]|uniref:Uncharacterized protein n=1 Tax=Mycobacteroides franklinii TaxID=948102 RepID=A0A4R8REY0_9MYCO|nr:hypothetical protein CCUG64054_04757 [Mycobacteroides franklinii]TDZ53860.1 hypothetical protein CCUG63697_00025 [Mycobacteroides franklinii]TDZ54397.1 hypothetical protein CCUG63696_04752 [Mycobacteroides franklinii]TDZ61030.1 hypothetical protein CCUG63695_04780 [Mycobacteroides franklinii]TDZ67718.1 hypothetical protein CCUG64056_04757 [Mycobacteroides franklinii]